MEPSGVNGLLSHKPSCYTVYTLLKKTNMETETENFGKNRETEETAVFFLNVFYPC